MSVLERTANMQAAAASDGARLTILRKEQVLLQEVSVLLLPQL
jgi:hypothetical protein